MERWARTQFHVIKISRWSVAVVLLVLLAVLLFPARGLMPASIPPADVTVRQGVTMWGRDFSGKTEAEARAMLSEMAATLQVSPVAASEHKDSEGISYVIPELNGYDLDIETTWFRLSVAGEGSRIEPARRIQAPPAKLADFPLQSVIRQGNPRKPAVSLLVNVDWGTKELTEMLPVLKRHGVKVTFFVSGRWADHHEKLLRQMADDGHEIASHGYDLRNGPRALAQSGKLKPDIARSVAAIERITGQKVRYYAPHMSEVSPAILETAAALRLRTVLYSLDTIDWRDSTTPESILRTIGKAKAGDLILLHPKPNTARVMENAILSLRGRGLQPMTLTEVLSPDPGPPAGAFTGPHEG